MARDRSWARRTGMFLMLGTLMGAGERLLAHQSSADNLADEQRHQLEGVWRGLVTIRDCQTGTAFVSFHSMEMFIRGGAYVGESSSPPAIRATGMGAWRHSDGRRYTNAKQFFTYAADGNPAGAIRVLARIRLNEDGTAYTSSDTFEVFDLAGNLLRRGCGTAEATRLF